MKNISQHKMWAMVIFPKNSTPLPLLLSYPLLQKLSNSFKHQDQISGRSWKELPGVLNPNLFIRYLDHTWTCYGKLKGTLPFCIYPMCLGKSWSLFLCLVFWVCGDLSWSNTTWRARCHGFPMSTGILIKGVNRLFQEAPWRHSKCWTMGHSGTFGNC